MESDTGRGAPPRRARLRFSIEDALRHGRRLGHAGRPARSLGISVQSATYGASCGIQADNAGASVKAFCDGSERCEYLVNARVLGDPKYGCKKDFVVRYACQGAGSPGLPPRLRRRG